MHTSHYKFNSPSLITVKTLIGPCVVPGNGAQCQVLVVGIPAQTTQLLRAQGGVEGSAVLVVVRCQCPCCVHHRRTLPLWKSDRHVTHYRHSGAVFHILSVIPHLGKNGVY